MKNLLKYTLGLPFLLFYSFIWLIGIVFNLSSALLDGDYEIIDRYLFEVRQLWRPIE